MNTAIFEGYIGIRTGDGQFIYDMLLLLVFLLFAFFAVIFRMHFPLFAGILNELFSVRERQSLFDGRERGTLFFTGFLKFQTLFLCALFVCLVYGNYTGFQSLRLTSIAGMVLIFFGILCLFYLFKQCLYWLYGFIFGEKDDSKRWNGTYHNLSCLWGISLYIPVVWLILDHQHLTEALLLFALLYLCFRFTLIYMTVRIFYSKNTGILYLCSYLCAQEIVPLLFLYEGMNYLYNTIEVSTLWH
ncbi:MAG: DUF4271 domain-containing protein [Tannerella sp.]|jgi:hypothetical protein|nr:DUF4271 domain-containing protein [Tannerella sp.]